LRRENSQWATEAVAVGGAAVAVVADGVVAVAVVGLAIGWAGAEVGGGFATILSVACPVALMVGLVGLVLVLIFLMGLADLTASIDLVDLMGSMDSMAFQVIVESRAGQAVGSMDLMDLRAGKMAGSMDLMDLRVGMKTGLVAALTAAVVTFKKVRRYPHLRL
jgi:hypothetical protein